MQSVFLCYSAMSWHLKYGDINRSSWKQHKVIFNWINNRIWQRNGRSINICILIVDCLYLSDQLPTFHRIHLLTFKFIDLLLLAVENGSFYRKKSEHHQLYFNPNKNYGFKKKSFFSGLTFFLYPSVVCDPFICWPFFP